MRLNIPDVRFNERDGTVRIGAVCFANVVDLDGLPSLASVGVNYDRDGEPVFLVVPAYGLAQESYERVCWAVSVEPWG